MAPNAARMQSGRKKDWGMLALWSGLRPLQVFVLNQLVRLAGAGMAAESLSMGHYVHPEPCPCCEAGPLLFVACSGCGAVIAWCGEQDYGIGRIEGGRLTPLGRGDRPDWARRSCPVCGVEASALGHADAGALASVGIDADGLVREG